MTDTWKNGIIIRDDPGAESAASAKLDPQVRTLLEADKREAVEELLLGRLGETPCDLRLYIPALRHFVKNNQTDTARMFLELLLDASRGRADGQEERTLLRAVLLVWPQAPHARTILVEQLRGLYGETPNIQRLIEHCRVFETTEPLRALRTLEYWLRYEENRGVLMPKKGAGRIREINIALETVRAVFHDRAARLSFKLDEAARLLEPLPPGHILIDAIDHPAELKRLAFDERGEFLRRFFRSITHPVPLDELKNMLADVIGADEWNAWWREARKDRHLTVASNNLCTWNDSCENAEAAILEQFSSSPVRDRMNIFRRCSDRSTGLASAMLSILAKDAENESEKNPAVALELLLTHEKLSSGKAKDMVISILNRADALDLILAISNRAIRKRALTLLRECRQDWQALYGSLIKSESDTQLLASLYDSLRATNPDNLDKIVTETMSSPSSAWNLFIWLCREMERRIELKHHAGWKLLQRVIELLTNCTTTQQPALKKLFDGSCVVYETARTLNEEQAKMLIAQLERDTVLEDYRRDKLLKYLRTWHPQTQETKEKLFYVSTAALKNKREEFVKLTSIDIPHNTEEIIKARAHGDLRENFEYHAARSRQEMLSSRAKTLHDELLCARPVERANINPSAVCIGTVVRLTPLQSGSNEVSITILGPWDSDPARNIISYQTPTVEKMLGKRKGEEVMFDDMPYTISDIVIAPDI